jgi:TRAP-type C4-dicarboxylate transport system substrate-binding protein
VKGFAAKGLVIAGLVIAALAAAPAVARAADPVTLKFGFPAPVNSYINTDGITPWINAVENAAGGTIKIELFAGSTLGTFSNIYERTLDNVAQISFGAFGTIVGPFPRTQVTNLPFLSDNTEQSSVALWRLYAEGLLDPEYGRVKVLCLFTFPGLEMNTNKPIATIDDAKGLRLAVPSRTVGDIAAKLGASPDFLTPTDFYLGVRHGLVDGVVVGWPAIKTFKLAEVTTYHLELPLGEAPSFVFMNRGAFAALPAEAKAAIDKFSGETVSRRMGTVNEKAAEDEGKQVAAAAGQSVTTLSPGQTKLWKARLQPIADAWAAQTPDGAKVLAVYEAELENIRGGH